MAEADIATRPGAGAAVLYDENPPMFRNQPLGFVLAVVLIAAFGLGILILLVWYVKAKSRRLRVTQNELLYEIGLLSKSRNELRLSTIRSVRVDQSLWQRMFGTGKVSVFTAGDAPEVVADGMPNPHRLREILMPG